MLVNLIINACLSEPPSESFALRTVMFVAKLDLRLDILVESSRESKDMYYKYMKERGLFDFAQQIITPEENEEGIELGEFPIRSRCIQTDRVTLENYHWLMNRIERVIRPIW